MVTFHKTFAATFVAAVGLEVAATPLPYTQETGCLWAFMDGSTSTECVGAPVTEVFTMFGGANGTNSVSAVVGSGAATFVWVGEDGVSHEGIAYARVTNNLWFTGITPGPVRPGIAEIDIYVDGDGSVVGGGRHVIASFAGGPSCEFDAWHWCHRAQEIPITLGQTFSFSILSWANASEGGGGGGVGSVSVTTWDAERNPVPIYAAAAVPEPGQLASAGLALMGGAYAIQRRLKR
jgi:hypothetical protein